MSDHDSAEHKKTVENFQKAVDKDQRDKIADANAKEKIAEVVKDSKDPLGGAKKRLDQ